MNDYVILTESTVDLTPAVIKELGIVVLPMPIQLSGKDYMSYPDGRGITNQQLYSALRNGETGKTSSLNPDTIINTAEPFLKEGKDVFYAAFSSGLSSSYNNAHTAKLELSEKYPDRKFVVVDTKAASMGQGLLVYHCVMKQRKGFSIEQLEEYLLAHRDLMHHWFTADDLNFLKRGGRISATSAILGTALGIKPVIHLNEEGKPIPVSKARGRKQALSALVNQMEKYGEDLNNQVVFVSHSDCLQDAEFVKKLINDKFHPKKVFINTAGPTIGLHAGPGAVAVFFYGCKKNDL